MQPEVNIEKLVAQKDIVFSNSLIESVNKRIKYDFLYTVELTDAQSTFAYLPIAIPQCNGKPHHSLHGYSPSEV